MFSAYLAQHGRGRIKNTWRLIAFLCRYANQSAPEMLRSLTVTQLIHLRDATQSFLDGEAESMRRSVTED